jgi:hypothetical protein
MWKNVDNITEINIKESVLSCIPIPHNIIYILVLLILYTYHTHTHILSITPLIERNGGA